MKAGEGVSTVDCRVALTASAARVWCQAGAGLGGGRGLRLQGTHTRGAEVFSIENGGVFYRIRIAILIRLNTCIIG